MAAPQEGAGSMDQAMTAETAITQTQQMATQAMPPPKPVERDPNIVARLTSTSLSMLMTKDKDGKEEFKKDENGERLEIWRYNISKDKDQICIGRQPTCEINVTQNLVSGRHARIYRDSKCRFTIELLSNNGLFLGDILMKKGETRILKHGDEISLCVHPHLHNGNDKPFAVFNFLSVSHGNSSGSSSALQDANGNRYLTEMDVQRDWDLSTVLGSGNFSDVRLGIRVMDGSSGRTKWAVKMIDKKKFKQFQTKRESRVSLSDEAEMLKKLSHPNIVKVTEYFETEAHLYLVMELLEAGDLLQSLLNDGCFSESQARRAFSQLMGAVKYLHAQSIVHRDLKPENVLLTTRDREKMQLKIADFGLARHNMKTRDCRTFCGTPHYFAPEVIRAYDSKQRDGAASDAAGYGKQVDMWSLGVILYILLSGVPPFEEEGLYEQILDGKYEFDVAEWTAVSEEAKELVRKLMCVNPKDRLTIEQAVTHKWFCKGVSVCDSSPVRKRRAPSGDGRSTDMEAKLAASKEPDPKRPRGGQDSMHVDGTPPTQSAAGA
jgi:serine/threonine protein kinase